MTDLTKQQVFQGMTALTDWGLLTATGSDAAKFLHGQLTQDVAGLAPGVARLAGYCSPKGRLLATFVIWRGGDSLHLACSADLSGSVVRRLSMFVLRADCRLSEAGAGKPIRGLAGARAQAWLGDDAPREPWAVTDRRAGGQVIRLPDVLNIPRYLLVGDDARELDFGPPLDLEAWRWLEVASGIPRVVAATSDQFVPQMINFEAVGGVNFQKGCYPGQEVVARSQYRGSMKRRARLFQSESPCQAGQSLFSVQDPDQPAGMVVLAARDPLLPERWALLAEVKTAALEASLHLDSAHGPLLAPLPLPYPLPSDT